MNNQGGVIPQEFLASSDPDVIPPGAASKVRLLLQLVQEYEYDLGKAQSSVAGILCVLEDVKSGLERFHAPASKKAELRRCNTDLRRTVDQRRPLETAVEENQRLRKELSATLTARKSLEKMFSSLGKEKEIMAGELARKAHELHDLEEHLSDVKAQNEKLLTKVKHCVAEHKEKKSRSGGEEGEKALLDRNKALSEQLLRALDGYRNLKRKVRDLQDEKAEVQERMADMASRASKGLRHIREFCRRLGAGSARQSAEEDDLEEDISSIEEMLRSLQVEISSAIDGRGRKMEEFLKAAEVADVTAGARPSVLA